MASSAWSCYVSMYISLYIQQKDYIRERPFNLKGGGGMFFFLKKYSDSQCCWKKYSDFGGRKKNNMIQSFCHITLVLSEYKFLNETKNHNPSPLQVKWSVPKWQGYFKCLDILQKGNVHFPSLLYLIFIQTLPLPTTNLEYEFMTKKYFCEISIVL